jgi:hypothetical protein
MANVTDELTAPPELEEQPKSRGCLYGCIFVVVGGLAMIICAGVAGYWFVSSQVTKYTSPDQMEMSAVEYTAEQMDALQKRVNAFTEALDRGETPEEDLVLTAEEINALITQEEEMKGKVFVTIEEGQISGDVSIPTDILPGGKGRFFNGKATVDVSMDRGNLIVIMTGAEVNGEKLPQDFIDAMAQQNLARDVYNNPDAAKVLRKFDSVAVEGDKLVLKVRRDQESKEEPAEDDKPADGGKPAEADSPVDDDAAAEEGAAEDSSEPEPAEA